MVTKHPGKRWAVRLSITRRGGWSAWGPASGDFERSLASQAGSNVMQPRIDAETRRGRDHVRITLTMTVASADVASALAEAWQAFSEAARGDPRGWDLASAAAEVRPEGP
jgi:DNA-binding GntR family transcriptional regulator